MVRIVMVPLDGSELAGQALQPAAALAAHHDARLLLVTVHEAQAATEALDRADRNALETYLDGALARTIERWRVPAEAVMLDAKRRVPERLAELARSRAVDLIVMTTHGRGSAGRAWFGSVADYLVRTADCPILLIRPSHVESRAGFRRILIPLDGSADAELALEDLHVVDSGQSEILVLRVVVPVIAFVPNLGGTGPLLTGGVLEDQRAEAERYAAAVAARLGGEGRRTRGMAVIDTSPAAAILDAADEHQSDLIVLAGRRRSGADRFLLGSVMDKLVRQAPVPVLIRRALGDSERKEARPAAS